MSEEGQGGTAAAQEEKGVNRANTQLPNGTLRGSPIAASQETEQVNTPSAHRHARFAGERLGERIRESWRPLFTVAGRTALVHERLGRKVNAVTAGPFEIPKRQGVRRNACEKKSAL
ncbi:hypothetical protein ALC53_00940 [Atta colombica]|uniref:Uncharacterized protein n=1 Tax=Atta colombica TaxID=520822 RepID=A0A195BW27_9HYME|nr:hypothetical protein ALC53_00940 [Atta colombica]